jgi:hypothetical protein
MKMQAIALLALLSVLSIAPGKIWTSPAFASEQTTTLKSPSLAELQGAIENRLQRVQEFEFIRQEAQRLGVRAWLFGGTAAGYAHYVKWDMLRESGDRRFQPDRFDYDYTNIYRSTQDLDIVIDGKPEQAEELQKTLAAKYPHLQGSKSAWEVRLLKEDMGDKLAILKNPDFLNQHSDSNSTGMIEITKPKAGESVVRDIRDWNSREPFFLKDIRDGALHYYFSQKHDSTKFAKEGRNPPILSAIRYLTKAFQYELKLRPEDLARIKKVISDFNPNKDTRNDYVKNWIEKNAKKLIQNAVNIEYAWDTLESLGLRKKLIAIRDNPGQLDSLAWWMEKEPLRMQALGKGSGKTAKELGLDIVAHESNGFLAYESITRAHTGEPNVLISRNGASGEAAIYGDGFYTKIGKEGAAGTGYTIRFHLNPNAREGTDFILPKQSPDYVLVRNKAALDVIPESMNMTPVDYFRILAGGKSGISQADRGILEKFKRRVSAKMGNMSESEIHEIRAIVEEKINSELTPLPSAVLEEWFSLPISKRYPQYVEKLIQKDSPKINEFVVRHILSQPHFSDREDWIEKFWNRPIPKVTFVNSVFSKPHWAGRPEYIRKLLNLNDPTVDNSILYSILTKSEWKNYPEFVETLIGRGTMDGEIALYIMTLPFWSNHPEWVVKLWRRGDPGVRNSILWYVLSLPDWQKNSQSSPEFKALVKLHNLTFDESFKGCLIRAFTRATRPANLPYMGAAVPLVGILGTSIYNLTRPTHPAPKAEKKPAPSGSVPGK